MADKVWAYSKATGRKQLVPAEFLNLAEQGVQGYTDFTTHAPGTEPTPAPAVISDAGKSSDKPAGKASAAASNSKEA